MSIKQKLIDLKNIAIEAKQCEIQIQKINELELNGQELTSDLINKRKRLEKRRLELQKTTKSGPFITLVALFILFLPVIILLIPFLILFGKLQQKFSKSK